MVAALAKYWKQAEFQYTETYIKDKIWYSHILELSRAMDEESDTNIENDVNMPPTPCWVTTVYIKSTDCHYSKIYGKKKILAKGFSLS